ncbi:bifunctional UDP-N-acetylmuramoyl-tripeptide:D-alanyl-D-alanine ligase/alanine racemase [Cyclobacterium amurskyense]|uniref:Alanine racemase n=1 Tax=Cyclobacterium amurskyense TaxID=320787 RepID=A0A0H4PS03_9BACT|nr:bifunctional UDP-N-acetylmuramoyl-tripeptide:D-alanyl-D-alanine ligase/alanine racemase [Cyclobacterium amurskyense]AKP51042.1 Alanine racemase [Cyclobacterium amurskyense]
MMQAINFLQFASKFAKNFTTGSDDYILLDVVIDSRKIQSGSKTLFVALNGSRYSGWEFAEDAYSKGVRNFILPEDCPDPILKSLEQANILLSPSPLRELQELAQLNRDNFAGPVIGITGSNGKTIVKEWLAQVLSSKYDVWKSPKSYNSQIGVALSSLGISQQHQVAVLEAGISAPNEMNALAQIIQPQLGIFTNIGSAHDEYFLDSTAKIREKCLLFKNVKYLIYRKDQSLLSQYLEKNFDPSVLVSWSDEPGGDYVLSIKPHNNGSKIFLIGNDFQTHTFITPFKDQASLENVRHVITAALSLGMKPDVIQQGLGLLLAVDMRLTLKSGINGSKLIDDSYNNDLAGLEIALEFMSQQITTTGRKILILSEMQQVGNEKAVFQKIAWLLEHYEIDLFIGVGKGYLGFQSLFTPESIFYDSTEVLLKSLDILSLSNDLILIKGARAFQFENIVQKLEALAHETILEINLNALRHNFIHYRQKLKPGTKMMVMVKAFAYGGGAAEIGNYLQEIGADYLSVAYTDEGVFLRNNGITLPIMVMNPGSYHLDLLLDKALEPVVYNLDQLKSLADGLKDITGMLSVHLELDTGMRRLGMSENDLDEAIKILQQAENLKISGIFTHLAGADEAVHESFSLQQLASFERSSSKIIQETGCQPIRHCLNSAGIIRYPKYSFDMVRLGIGLYGIEVNQLEQDKLQPAMTLKTVVSQVKKLKKGETIGYGRKGEMANEGEVATLAIGYADGYDRRFSNGKAKVLIKGQMAPIIGNVCMDMCMVDVTGLQVTEGDVAILFGNKPSIIELAANIGTIPYELLTGIGPRVKRQYILD